jgi:pyrophosphatase PpaX
MKSYDYVLFDWDGCLAKTLEVWFKAHKLVFAEYGVYPSDREIAHHFGDWESPKHFGIGDITGCIEKIARIANKNLDEVELYEGAKELLTKLRQSKKLALLSSSRRDVLDQGIKHNGLGGFFTIILTAEDVENHKPHPEVIEKGMAALGAVAKSTVMIGDSRKDLDAAKNARIDSILVYPEEHEMFYDIEELNQYSPTYIVNGFNELAGQLKLYRVRNNSRS